MTTHVMNRNGVLIPEQYDLSESMDILSQQLHNESKWIEISGNQSQKFDFSVEDRKTISQQAQIYFIKNPLIGLAVTLKTTFIFGSGVTAKADHPLIQEVVIDDFWNDRDNKAELTGLQAQHSKCNSIQLDGNIFLCFFTNFSNGRVKVSSIDPNEVDEIITHPENRRKPLFYKRTYLKQKFDYETGVYVSDGYETKYYRDWRSNDPADKIYDPPVDKIAMDSAGREVLVYHKKVNCTDKQKFGISETYRAHDWAKAYTSFLGDLASIWKTLAIFAAERKMKNATAGQIAAAKAQTQTYSTDGNTRLNRPPAAGSTRIANQNDEWVPVKTSGVTMSAEDGRRLLLMVCAAMGIFEHYFGDASSGNLAVADAMELPMLKMFEARQMLFQEMFTDIFDFVIRQSARASGGKLKGYVIYDRPIGDTGYISTVSRDDPNGKIYLDDPDHPNEKTGNTEISQAVSLDFPPITMQKVNELITGLKTALTLDGSPKSDTPMINAKTAARLALTALKVDNIDEIIEELFPGGEEDFEEEVPPYDPNGAQVMTTGGTSPDEDRNQTPPAGATKTMTAAEARIINILEATRQNLKKDLVNLAGGKDSKHECGPGCTCGSSGGVQR